METIKVLKRLVKQRKESAEQYRKADRDTQADAEDAERAVLESYLPEEMSEEDIRAVVMRIRKDMNISEKKDKGSLMKATVAELRGRADGSTVARVVDAVLS